MNNFNSPVPFMITAALSSSTQDLLREAMTDRHYHQLEFARQRERKKWHVSGLRDRFQKHTARQ